ncbi:rieske domain protein [Fusarium beomiforme]|uniref:Rieske domain protein n=1 Tax=Fusarium beomiforme TaxID=44412 RepID=A0A9P5AJ35_9HYPO|nr:rieske domain protein [Fusarium beomiforme]
MNFLNPFSRQGAQWTFVGHTSSFPDVDDDAGNLAKHRLCNAKSIPGCKAFLIPKENVSSAKEVPIGDESLWETLTDQVLVFQYKGKFHAIDHSCPHNQYPLSKGTPFDIEDFGVVLSAGVSCPNHDWSFDLFTGMSDRGSYRLKTWEVEIRDIKEAESTDTNEKIDPATDKEVWVRRKQRIG